MRTRLTFAFTVCGLAVATPGHAANGVVDLTWGGTCTPIVQVITPTAGPTSMIASELGNDQTHNAYQVRVLIGSAARTVPDAWRFDAGGCQQVWNFNALSIHHVPPATAAKTCPAFQGTNPISYQLKHYAFVDPGGIHPTSIMRSHLANTYPAGMTAVATTRYFLAQWVFDHTFSVAGATTPGVTCGGFETPMCVALLTGWRNVSIEGGTSSYLRVSDGHEIPFDPGPNDWLSTHGLAGCPGVLPAVNRTWGGIKSQYRN
jgi:hypothetical protein